MEAEGRKEANDAVRYALGHDRVAMIFGEAVVDGDIGSSRHHLGQIPALEFAEVIRWESFPLKIGRPKQALLAKESQCLMTF
jgi:hypothetical protein